jgi:conjugative relaxase-like TrwC/TraI family protein
MINIAQINNPEYLFAHSAHEYMSEGGDEIGYLAGRGSKYMGMEGKECTQKIFNDMITKGGLDNLGVEIDPGAPKDWTILYNRVSDDDRARMNAGFTQALKDTAKAIEENTYYRKTVNGKESYELARGVTMAIFQHHTSRAVSEKEDKNIHAVDIPKSNMDCHEHGHIIVFPKVLGQDGKMYSHTLYDLIHEKDGQGNSQETLKYFDQVFQYSLAKFLTNEMGHTLSRGVKDSFKIDGITDDMRKAFSQRSEAIKEVAREDATYEEMKKISIKQRSNKTHSDLGALREGWQSKMDERGLKEEDLSSMKGKQKDLDRNFKDTFEGSTVISNKKLKMMALSEAKFSSKTADQKLKEFKESKALIKIGKNQNINAKSASLRNLANDYNQNKIIQVKDKMQKKPSSKSGPTPGGQQIKNTAVKSEKGSKLKQSDRIAAQISDLSNNHSLRMLQITTSSATKPAKEGALIAKEIANFNEQHAQLMSEYSKQLQQENNSQIDI